MSNRRDERSSGGRMPEHTTSGHQGPGAPGRPSGSHAGPPASPALTNNAKEPAREGPGAAAAAGVGPQTQSSAPAAPNPAELAPAISLPKGGGALKNIGDKFEANASAAAEA